MKRNRWLADPAPPDAGGVLWQRIEWLGRFWRVYPEAQGSWLASTGYRRVFDEAERRMDEMERQRTGRELPREESPPVPVLPGETLADQERARREYEKLERRYIREAGPPPTSPAYPWAPTRRARIRNIHRAQAISVNAPRPAWPHTDNE